MARKPLTVGIIGSGWYGCHSALELSKAGFAVSLFEKNSDILSGVSGSFGIRLHKGPHYPRSRITREMCRGAYDKFLSTYPDLVIPHQQSLYAHGITDAMGNPSKVSEELFREVCHESPECVDLVPETTRLRGVTSVYDLQEPSIVVGERLRNAFTKRLAAASIKPRLNSTVTEIKGEATATRVTVDGNNYYFDVVINATAYKSLIPGRILQSLPADIRVAYQSTIGVVYRDRYPGKEPFGFIVLDGAFPCLIPMVTTKDEECREYVVIHGCYTILATFDDHDSAQRHLNQLDKKIMETKIRPPLESELERFWPGFHDRFAYSGFKGAVIPKLRTTSEFRSSLTFEKDGVVYLFPGKINNIFTASEEAITLVNELLRRRYGDGYPCDGERVLESDGVRYTAGGALAIATKEIADKPVPGELHTTNLQTFAEL